MEKYDSASNILEDTNDYTSKNKSKVQHIVQTGNPSNHSQKHYQSPRKKISPTSQHNNSKETALNNTKRTNQVSSRVKAHYYNKNVISPHRIHHASNSKQQNLSKKSNLTIFTNNTLTSTLSPKSNLSLSTFKSSSKPKTTKASCRDSGDRGSSGNKKSLLQFQVGSNIINKLKKMDERQSCISPQA